MMQRLGVAFDVKALGARQFEGHAAVFRNVDLGGDIVVPGAFRRTLAEHRKAGTMPSMFWMHKPDAVPGVWESMEEDAKGLHVEGELVDTPLGNEIRTLLQKKAVRGLSIGYLPYPDGVDFDRDGNRLLKAVNLWEASPVSLAMNPLARVEAVKTRLSANGEYVPTEREFEEFLRKAGCSKTVARTLIARLYDDDPGGMPDGRRWDAGTVDDEDEQKAQEFDEAARRVTQFLEGFSLHHTVSISMGRGR